MREKYIIVVWKNLSLFLMVSWWFDWCNGVSVLSKWGRYLRVEIYEIRN